MREITAVADWTPIVDDALRLLEGVTSREAHIRYGFARETVACWRRRRVRGVPILAVRSGNRRALERLFDHSDGSRELTRARTTTARQSRFASGRRAGDVEPGRELEPGEGKEAVSIAGSGDE